jgi:uncharacterized membrane protein
VVATPTGPYGPAVTINGIPLHPLVVHAAVVLVPLAALLAGAYAVLPQRRWQIRTLGTIVAVASAVAIQLAVMTGDELKESLGEDSSLIQDHEHWAGLLQIASWVLAALMVIAWFALPHDREPAETSAQRGAAALAVPMAVLLLAAAVAVVVLVVLTGDTGAKSVWGDAGGDILSAPPVNTS